MFWWNLYLYMLQKKREKKFERLFGTRLWVGYLPNAPRLTCETTYIPSAWLCVLNMSSVQRSGSLNSSYQIHVLNSLISNVDSKILQQMNNESSNYLIIESSNSNNDPYYCIITNWEYYEDKYNLNIPLKIPRQIFTFYLSSCLKIIRL